jgi:uncharacterized Ntn-hydrolase superfamily protein
MRSPALCRVALTVLTVGTSSRSFAQMPADWRDSLVFHTFSIAAIDPRTGETGVAVTTRVACVGNGVPWVRVGVGAVATQASTRTEYGNELLDALAKGEEPKTALDRLLAADNMRASRQIGVIDSKGRVAQHTGTSPQEWKGHRTGPNYVAQGNVLVGPEVLEAVAENTGRHLAERLIDAIAAGHKLGGDRRHGSAQSAAVVVADPRQGMSRRTDGETVNINVCEHPEPVGELKRIYNAVSQTIGYRTIQQFSGNDVWQLKVMLHALGMYGPKDSTTLARGQGATDFGPDVVTAVNAFRTSVRLNTSPSGLVDTEMVEHLWAALEKAGKAKAVREALFDITAIRR